jgi:hypothetical protein
MGRDGRGIKRKPADLAGTLPPSDCLLSRRFGRYAQGILGCWLVDLSATMDDLSHIFSLFCILPAALLLLGMRGRLLNLTYRPFSFMQLAHFTHELQCPVNSCMQQDLAVSWGIGNTFYLAVDSRCKWSEG